MRIHALLLALALSLPSVGLAGERDPERRGKIMDKIDAIRVAKLTDALELDAKSAEKLFPVIRPFQERRRDAYGKRFEALRALDKELEGEKPDEKVLTGHLENLMKANREIAAIAEDEYDALKPVLDPVSLARYYRFQARFERKIGELIREIRGGGDGSGKAGGLRDRKRAP